MRIARVFPTKTSYCPTDQDAYYGEPELFTPKYDEVHISVTFTWDIDKGYRLKSAWEKVCLNVKIGGVAIDGESKYPSIPGIYVKKGVIFTSRGCPNKCSFCQVKNDLIEFDDFPEGNIIQDNNILACSDKHLKQVFDMLKTQKSIEFKGGLEARRITPFVVNELRKLRIKSLWLACDHKNAIKPMKKAVQILTKAGFTRNHIYCYVLIGKDRQEEENRLYEVLNAGALPFAQLYRDKEDSIKYSNDWKRFAREWSRPAIIRAKLNKRKR